MPQTDNPRALGATPVVLGFVRSVILLLSGMDYNTIMPNALENFIAQGLPSSETYTFEEFQIQLKQF